MSAEEMNALEKTALEDPFLSDALEGYTANTTGAHKDIEDLQHRLKNRLNKDHKIAAVHPFKWWKAAAVVILLAGAGGLVYTLTNTTRQTETLAKNEAAVPVPPALPDTLDGNIISLNEPAAGIMENNTDQLPAPAQKTLLPSGYKAARKQPVEDSQIIALSDKLSLRSNKPQQDQNTQGVEQKFIKEQMATVSVQQTAAPLANEKATHVFSGKIVSENNEPVPFATVLVINSQLAVSADAAGHFDFSFNDSLAMVNVNSAGFTPAQATLRTGLTNTEIKLQRDSNMHDAVIPTATGRAKNAATPAKSITSTNPDIYPVTGWIEYNRYIEKNKRVPAGKEGLQEQVVLSFSIDKNGRPAQIEMVKLASPAINAEAIRLLKEGADWKHNEQTRVVVTIRL